MKYFTIPESAGISISIGSGSGISSGISNDFSLNAGIMPKPGQTKISRTWFIWLENSCTGVEVTFC
jgi:hypothetical protein